MSLTDRESFVDSLLAQCADALRRGQRLVCSDLQAKHPEFAAEISAFEADYELVEKRFLPLRESTGYAGRTAAEIATLGHDDTAVPPPRAGQTFGDYDLLLEVARGGMGIVYKARQRSLNRIVALKMVLGGKRNPALEHDRFLVEARAVARLNHPNIVPIYEVGEQDGQPYFTMEFFSGGSLGDKLGSLKGDYRAIARMLITIARAVEHAHRRGVLHRDIKPTNVLLDERREPHVTDFGLAKSLDEKSDLTHAGAIVGTPSYMAPEQAQAATDLTTAVDVYGLGALMYDLLTGRPPFRGNTPLETMYAAVNQEPVRPGKLAADVDADLEIVCLKCLEKDPLNRYASADALADDLERWLHGVPIQARRASARERVVKWARRQPLVAGSLATISAALIGLLTLAGFLWQNAELRAQAVQDLGQAKEQLTQVDGERQEAEKAKTTAEELANEQRKLAKAQKALADKISEEVTALQKTAQAEEAKAKAAQVQAVQAQELLAVARQEANQTMYAANMQLAHAAWQNENIASVGELLSHYRKPGAAADLRGFEWHYLDRLIHRPKLSFGIPQGTHAMRLIGLAISPDGKRIVTAQMGTKLKLWNKEDGKLLKTFELIHVDQSETFLDNVMGVFFADEGRTITAIIRKEMGAGQMEKLVGKAMGKQHKLDVKEIREAIEFHSFNVDDEKSVAKVEPFDPVRLKTAVQCFLSGSFFLVDEGDALTVTAMDCSADGKFLALSCANSKVADGDLKMPGRINGGKLIVWDLAKGNIHAQQKLPTLVTAVVFSKTDDRIAVATVDGAVGIGTRDLVRPPQLLMGHRGMVLALQFSPDGKRLVSGAMDGNLILWDVESGKEIDRLRGHITAVTRAEFEKDGNTLVSGSMDGSVKVWDLIKEKPSPLKIMHEGFVAGVTFTEGGENLRAVDLTGGVHAWRVATSEKLASKKSKPQKAIFIRLSSSGKKLVYKDSVDQTVVVRDIESGKETTLSWKDHFPAAFMFSPDDSLLAACNVNGNGGVIIWNLEEGKAIATLENVGKGGQAPAFSQDCRLLVISDADRVVLWDWQAKSTKTILERKGGTAMGVALSHDGALVASASGDSSGREPSTVRIWDVKNNRLVCECFGAGDQIMHLEFSPDGRRLVSGGMTMAQQGILKVWDTAGGREVLALPLPQAAITDLAFSPDGNRIAAATVTSDAGAALRGEEPMTEIRIWDGRPVAGGKGKE